jgi:hypothetical protein
MDWSCYWRLLPCSLHPFAFMLAVVGVTASVIGDIVAGGVLFWIGLVAGIYLPLVCFILSLMLLGVGTTPSDMEDYERIISKLVFS